jgi:hypothetical protein
MRCFVYDAVDYQAPAVVAGSSSRPRTEMKPERDLRHLLSHMIRSFQLGMLQQRAKLMPALEPKRAPRVAAMLAPEIDRSIGRKNRSEAGKHEV